jgi:hypothetical protein
VEYDRRLRAKGSNDTLASDGFQLSHSAPTEVPADLVIAILAVLNRQNPSDESPIGFDAVTSWRAWHQI